MWPRMLLFKFVAPLTAEECDVRRRWQYFTLIKSITLSLIHSLICISHHSLTGIKYVYVSRMMRPIFAQPSPATTHHCFDWLPDPPPHPLTSREPGITVTAQLRNDTNIVMNSNRVLSTNTLVTMVILESHYLRNAVQFHRSAAAVWLCSSSKLSLL